MSSSENLNSVDGVDQSSATTNPEAPESASHRGAGRPRTNFTNEERIRIKAMAANGITYKLIARTYGCSINTLRRHCSQELFEGRMEADEAVLKSLYNMATSERCVTATIFFVKTRCQHLTSGFNQEPDIPAEESDFYAIPPALQAKSEAAVDSAPAVWKVEVYNNEGEPNADY
jgi:transposase-like protein